MNAHFARKTWLRSRRWVGSLLACVMLALLRPVQPADSPALTAAAGSPAKKLIEFGWDEPDTKFIREHIVEMQQTPFDGCVFHAAYTRSDGGQGNFTWEAWAGRAFTRAELQPAVGDLQATQFGRFKFNFLRFNTTPAKLDWFDDHSAVINNARLAAWVAYQGGCPGLLFDIEQYDGSLFDYRKQRDRSDKSWEIYAAQVRKRGQEIMDAFQEGFPDLQVFLTFGYSLPWAESHAGRKSLAECHYGLLAPFLDGMVRATRGHARLIDGHESSYGYRNAAAFAEACRMTKQDLLPIVANPDAYARVFSNSFAVWLDHDWRKFGWDTGDFSKNYYSPEAFRSILCEAIRAADQYVWIYSETPRWWSKDGKPVKLPEPYIKAVQDARADAQGQNAAEPPGTR